MRYFRSSTSRSPENRTTRLERFLSCTMFRAAAGGEDLGSDVAVVSVSEAEGVGARGDDLVTVEFEGVVYDED
jgi:hypothetical protein